MKKHLNNKLLWQTLLSTCVLGTIIIIAAGSLGLGASAEETKKDLGGGMIEKTIVYTFWDGGTEVYTGKEDEYGIRNGEWIIESRAPDGSLDNKEEVTYVNGIRTGISKTTDSDGYIKYECYRDGRVYPCTKSKNVIAEDASAFQVLAQRYPWFTNKLLFFGFDNEYVEAYLNTLETILDEFGDDPLEFDDNYADAVDSLTYTPYDSIIQRNSTFSILQGEEEVKKDEFRIATIDRYRSNKKPSFNIVENTYPGYLESIMELGITEEDFNGFCHVTDSLMDGDDALYGSLDLEHTFFVDSVDQRLFRAIGYILNYEDTTSALKSMKIKAILNNHYDFRGIYRDVFSQLSQSIIDSTTQNAATATLLFMILKFDQGDMMKLAVKEAWLNKRDVVVFPIVLTEFSGNISATSANLLGEVLEDGGADVTSRGMVWADFYNPTTNDISETSGSGLGTFEITLSDLTTGNTYYARSFATNSVGTAYGNCLKFTAGEAVGINEPELFVQNFTVYPNPAAGITTISFHVESSKNLSLTIVNLKGQAVYHHDPGILQPGVNKIELDVSNLPNGLYSYQLSSNGRIRGSQKVLIVH